MPGVGLTAWPGLVDLGGVTEGDRVLVPAGGGGVGHVAVQVAKALGGAYVITTASAGKREFVEGPGADEVIDYTVADLAERAATSIWCWTRSAVAPSSVHHLHPPMRIVACSYV